uniref:Uncharacterized protein n=1 Tax=Eutreptiella gymnastica TaxID=73025 RepID=A0A7S4G4R1_9EUGL
MAKNSDGDTNIFGYPHTHTPTDTHTQRATDTNGRRLAANCYQYHMPLPNAVAVGLSPSWREKTGNLELQIVAGSALPRPRNTARTHRLHRLVDAWRLAANG